MPTVPVTAVPTQNSPFSFLSVAVTIASTHFSYPWRDDQAELACMGGLVKYQDGMPANGDPSQ